MTDFELRKWCVEQIQCTFIRHRQYHGITPPMLAQGSQNLYDFMTCENTEGASSEFGKGFYDNDSMPENITIDLNKKDEKDKETVG